MLILVSQTLTFLLYSEKNIYKNLKDNKAVFRGIHKENLDIDLLDCIPIGLFVPDDKHSIANEIIKGVLLAVDEANAKGGYRGKNFCIKRRWSKDPWGGGSKDVINLIYKDKVLGIIAYKDGASHIALQIAAKINIPVLSPVSTDVSLTMTGVPWIFRLAPNDKKQAEVLYRDGIKKNNLKRLAILSETGHDIRLAVLEMIKVLNANKNTPVFHINLNQNKNEMYSIIKRIKTAKLDSLILVLRKNTFLSFLSLLRKNRIKIPVFSMWQAGVYSVADFDKSVFSIEPFIIKKDIKHIKLKTHSSIYSYDCTKILINAIKKNGLNRTKIRKNIKTLSKYKGLSGEIMFDNSGDNKMYPRLTYDEK